MSRFAAGRSARSTRPCPLCGAVGQEPSRPDIGRPEPHPVACAVCGLVFIDPVPDDAVSPATYDAGYYEPWQGREARARRRLWRRRLDAVACRAPGESLLDVGCGDGLFLQVARDAGWRVDGIEFSPEGARRAAARLGRPVAVGNLAATPHLQGPFDVVTFWHVLEHLAEPRPMLEAARRRLRAGGLLVVAVPNLDNRPMQWAYRVARRRPLPLFEPGGREPHLSHFSTATLTALLERSGFSDVEIVPDRCALTTVKRIVDTAAAAASCLAGRILTDALAAFSRRIP